MSLKESSAHSMLTLLEELSRCTKLIEKLTIHLLLVGIGLPSCLTLLSGQYAYRLEIIADNSNEYAKHLYNNIHNVI